MWGTGSALAPMFPRLDVWFELHNIKNFCYLGGEGVSLDDNDYKEFNLDTSYGKWLKSQTIPVYMHNPTPEIPTSVQYPRDEIIAAHGDRFCSSAAWMTALAIYSGAREIGFWGIDMKALEEWGHQRENMHYFLGLASGMGIKLTVHRELWGAECLYGIGNEHAQVRPPKVAPAVPDARAAIIMDKKAG